MVDLGALGGQNSSMANPTTNVRSLIAGIGQTGDPEHWPVGIQEAAAAA
jgi:hypothetical protein